MTDGAATPWDDLQRDFGFTDAEQWDFGPRVHQLHVDVERRHKFDAGLALGRALGHNEAREALARLGYHAGILIPLNLGGLERHLPPGTVVEATDKLSQAAPEDRAMLTTAWRATAEAYAGPGLPGSGHPRRRRRWRTRYGARTVRRHRPRRAQSP